MITPRQVAPSRHARSPRPSRRLARLVALLAAAALAPLVSPAVSPALAEPGCWATGDPVGSGADGSTLSTVLSAVTCLVNDEREAWGLPSLTRFAMLDAAAAAHDAWMTQTHVFDHVESGAGSQPQPSDRVQAAGYQWSFVAENIAAGQRTAYDVVQVWLHSVGHCKNILSPQPTDLGLDVSTGSVTTGGAAVSPVWTMVLGRWSGESAPSSSTVAQAACDAGSGFQPRSEDLRDHAEPSITVTDGAGRPVAPQVDEVHNPAYGTAMERVFTLTNTSSTPIVNPAFVATITDHPLDQGYLSTPGDVVCLFDDPATPAVVPVEQGCVGTGDDQHRSYVPTTIQPGGSVKVRIGSYDGPSFERLTGNVTGFRVMFGGHVTSSGSYVPASASEQTFSMRWTWKISRTSVGFGIPSAQDRRHAALVVGAKGTATWSVPVDNKGVDGFPLELAVFVSAARGASIVSASMPGARCVVGTSHVDGSRGVRCTVPPDTLTARSTRTLTVVARPASTKKATPHGKALDRGAIGVAMAGGVEESMLAAFRTDEAMGGPVFDTLPADYLGVRRGRVTVADNLDDQERAASFCLKGNDCDLDLDGRWDALQAAAPARKSPAALTVKPRGAKKKATFAITVTTKKNGKKTPVRGRVTVARKGGKALKTVTLSARGKARVTVTKQARGKKRYTVTYRGTSAVRGTKKTVTVRVR